MVPKDHNDCVVTVTIELGHYANFLKEPSLEGFTHDWTVFVRGKDGSKIEHFVEKVVFKLHKTFKCPTRAICEPPYKVNESGYAGFILPIEIHFKNKQSPRKIYFSYDLFLNVKDQPPINNFRYEKLKFSNPTPEFKAKLIKAGGIQQGGDHEQQPLPYVLGSPVKSETKKSTKKFKDGIQEKKKKKHKPAKEASPASSLSSLSPLSSDDDDDDDKEDKSSSLHPPAFQKKEKEAIKKEWSSSSQSKPETSSSSHHNKSKHKSVSQSTSSKDRSEKESQIKKHKSEDRDKEREKHSSSHKSNKEKKVKESGSHSQHTQKSSKEASETGHGHSSPPSVSKISNAERKNSSSSLHTEGKEKYSSTPKEISISHHKDKHNSHKGREGSSSSKVKQSSSHKDNTYAAEKNHEHFDKKLKEKDKHDKKNHKRSSEGSTLEEGVEKKKIKTSTSSTDDIKSTKPKNSHSKSKDVDSKHVSKDSKDIKSKNSPPKDKEKERVVVKKEKSEHFLPIKKHKLDKGKEKHVDKQKTSKEKHRENTVKEQDTGSIKEFKKEERPVKSEALLQTEHLAMTADFQPRLLVSPLKNDSSSDEDSGRSSNDDRTQTKQKKEVKHSVNNSNVSSTSLHPSHPKIKANVKQETQIMPGIADSDSGSDDKEICIISKNKSPKREMDSETLKQKRQRAENSSETSQAKKYRSERKLSSSLKPTRESLGENISEKDEDCFYNVENNSIEHEEYSSKTNNDKGLDILAPNGFSLRELIEINEKIEKAYDNARILEKLVHLVGETDEFDLDEKSFYFDICSLNTSVVKKIQSLLKEY
ncbi:hypothetical protein RRG08_048839 [Elysia crispata]|uniref:YEATS domain-containing protein n=1 Tax=Elysia crispata TaxID=231223 RepID=A0AAE1EAY4_9GAST|nr:hypothetical protein RRG08_048839 [Elysia crispata]